MVWGWRMGGGRKKREMAKWKDRRRDGESSVLNSNRNHSWLSISSSSPPCAVISVQREEERLSAKLSQHQGESSLLTHVSEGGRGNSLPLCSSLCPPWPGSHSSSPLQQVALANTDLWDVQRVQICPLHSTLQASPAPAHIPEPWKSTCS